MRNVILDVDVRRHRVTLDNPGPPVPDGDGGYVQGWTPLDPPSRWAAIRPATPADLERVVAGTVAGSTTHIVEMGYHPGVTLETRITYHGRVFAVHGMQNVDERNVKLILACGERAGAPPPPAAARTTEPTPQPPTAEPSSSSTTGWDNA